MVIRVLVAVGSSDQVQPSAWELAHGTILHHVRGGGKFDWLCKIKLASHVLRPAHEATNGGVESVALMSMVSRPRLYWKATFL